MPIATFAQYCDMLDNAKRGRFAYPAINIAGLEGLNATLEGFAEARSDGIVQVSSGGGAHATGPALSDMALGAQVLAEAAHSLAARYDGVLKIGGEVGEKAAYDPRSYLRKATAGMKARVVQACADLRSTGTSLSVR